MLYQDFIQYINSQYGLNETYNSLENLIEYGISWCEEGKNDNDEPTTKCAYCLYYKECDTIHEIMKDKQ